MSDKDNTPQTNPLYIKPKRQKVKKIRLDVFVRKSLPKLLLRYAKYLDAKINDTSTLDKYRSWNKSLQLTKYYRRSSLPYYSTYITDKKKKK